MTNTFFAPQLFIPNGVTDIDFYRKALGATEIMRINNEDGTVHVAEFSVDGMLFHLHEETSNGREYAPASLGGTTVLIGLFVKDVDLQMQRALDAGAELLSPATSYDYGYRQGQVRDPFGHCWMFESKI
jgi:PhnB protein